MEQSYHHNGGNREQASVPDLMANQNGGGTAIRAIQEPSQKGGSASVHLQPHETHAQERIRQPPQQRNLITRNFEHQSQQQQQQPSGEISGEPITDAESRFSQLAANTMNRSPEEQQRLLALLLVKYPPLH